MSTTILTDEQIDATLESLDCLFWDVSEGATHDFARAIEQAVLQSPEARTVRRNTLLSVLVKLNSNPYSLTKSECIDVVREMFEEADAALKEQP